MSKLIMMRHGQSRWNELNLFTGWVDVPLSLKGIEEALEGGEKIKDIPIDVIFTSSLMRAQQTAMLAMLQHSSRKTPVIQHPGQGKLEDWGLIYSEAALKETIPVYCAWEINERMYGELQGLNKAETMEKFGKEQVQIWRRSYDVAPPGGESLEMTAARSIPYFKDQILPALKNGLNVFISAHGNSLRSIIMFLDNLSKEEVVRLELATGEPILYDYIDHQFFKQ
ncbi:MAG: 2,3-bisphosphoglycerate-dependent phosphoglycerate mutase [Parachlamydiaceae bacterium]|nr:MAG: 2,3-bisphosphoglycerate-dependent phosphoglycerate mutase [Parachlamydiaceae bacterium]